MHNNSFRTMVVKLINPNGDLITLELEKRINVQPVKAREKPLDERLIQSAVGFDLVPDWLRKNASSNCIFVLGVGRLTKRIAASRDENTLIGQRSSAFHVEPTPDLYKRLTTRIITPISLLRNYSYCEKAEKA